MSDGDYVIAYRPNRASQGTPAPTEHATEPDAPRHDATAVCGLDELVVIEEHDGTRLPFDPDSGWSCKRCAKRVR